MLPLIGMFVVAAVIVGVVELEGRGKNLAGTTSTTREQPTTTTLPPVPPPPVKSALAPWNAPLPVPINQALVMAGPGAKLLIIGGEVSNGTSGVGGFLMNTTTGALEQVVNLAAAVHDASGATLGHEEYVFGGKGIAVTSSVQSFPTPSSSTSPASPGSPTTTAATPSVVTATATGSLPVPRAGSAAVTIGATVYIVGGYHKGKAEASVLSTSDGGTFTTVASLPVPVRNAAVAVAGGDIYVFGGAMPATAVAGGPTTAAAAKAPSTTSTPSTTAAGGTTNAAVTWAAVADIQRIDPVTGQATVVGRLPARLQGAVAVTLNGKIYVAGGSGPAGVNGLIWGFEPPDAGLALAGHLKVPVSGPGVTTIGATAWLVGGEAAGGHLVGSIQTFRPSPGPVPSPGPGLSRSTTTTKTSPVPSG